MDGPGKAINPNLNNRIKKTNARKAITDEFNQIRRNCLLRTFFRVALMSSASDMD
jgi:hypothetical protein